jgi:hypothetical protein
VTGNAALPWCARESLSGRDGDKPTGLHATAEAKVTLRREVASWLRERGYRGQRGAFGLRLDEGFSYVIDVGPLNQRTDIHPAVGL